MAKRARKTFSDQIRAAVEASRLSRYRISIEIGTAQSSLSRFMSGKGGLSMSSLDRLADLLGLDVVARPEANNEKG